MKKVLVVDDNQDNTYLLKSLLEGNGYQVTVANEGQQALDKLRSEKVDLIISDILMPVMDGFLLCHECHKDEKLKQIPFVFYSATYTDVMDEDLALKLGADKFIRKPIELDKLLTIIENVLENKNTHTLKDSESEVKEEEILKLYSESLINKLEHKNIELIQEIAERQKAEEALSLSEKGFKAIFEQAAIGVAEIDSETFEFRKVNQKYCDITGYTFEELTKLTFRDITHPDDLQLDINNMTRLKKGEISEFTMEKRYFRKGGQIVWVNLTVSPIWSPGEKPTTHIATIHDITEQKLAEKELRKSERHLRSVLENEPECVKILGLRGELLEMNAAGLAMIEADSFEQVRGKQVLQIVMPEFRDAFANLTKNVLDGANGTLEFELIGLKGTRRWLETNATPLRDESGKVVSLLGVTRDITDRKRFATALVESEDRYRDLVENSFVLMMTHDLDGNILSVNKTAAKSLGYSQKELEGKNIKNMFLPQDLAGFDDYIQELKEKGVVKGKGRIVTKSGELRIGEYANTLRTEGVDKPIVRGVATDITEKVFAERALKRSERDYRTIFEQAHDAIIVFEPNTEIVLDVNERACELYGFSRSEFIGLSLVMISNNSGLGKEKIQETIDKGEFLQFETTQYRKDGTPMLLEVNASRIAYQDQTAIISINRDVTERRESEAIITGQKKVLEMVALGAPLNETLLTLVKVIEAQSAAMICSILLLDEDGIHLRSCASPSLPEEYVQAIDGVEIGDKVGSCGTAAFRGETVIVEDIATDPLWEDYRELAIKSGLRACWSTPILDANRKVLGTFAIYYRQPALPTEKHLRLIELATDSAAIAISSAQSKAALLRSEQRLKEAQSAGRIGDWQFYPKSGQIIWSDALYEIFNRNPELGPPTYEEQLGFYTNEDSQKLDKCVQNALKTGEGYELDLKVILPNKREMFIFALGQALKDDSGEIVKLYGVAQDITERKVAEDAIRFQAHLLDTVKQAVIATDINGIVVYWNRFAETLYGWSDEEAVGQAIFDLVLPELQEKETSGILELLRIRKSWVGERFLQTKSGKQFSSQVFVSPVTDNDETLIGFVGISFDVTERKRSELALQKSEERLRTLFDQMIDGFYYSTHDGKLIDINPAMVKMFGYSSKEEMLAVDVAKDLYFHPEDRRDRFLVDGKTTTEIYPMRRKDGSVIWVEDSGRYIYDEEGNIQFHEGVLRDVTERKLAEDRLQEMNERLDLSQKVAKIGSFEWDIQNNTNFWSPGMEALYGLETGSYSGDYEGWKKAMHPDDLAETKKAMKIALETGEIYSEYRIILPNKEVRWIHARAKVFYDDDNKPLRMVGVNMDVTAKKEAEKAIDEANVRAIREYEILLDILSKLAQTVGAARDINAIFKAILKFTSDSISCAALIISLKENESNKRKPIYFWYNDKERDVSELENFPKMDDLIDTAIKIGEVVISKDLTRYYDYLEKNSSTGGKKRPQNLKSALVAPMKIKGEVVGVIEVQSYKSDAYGSEHSTAMRLAANLVANAIENVRLIELEQHREEQLQKSQKLESVGRLAGGIAHDFNNMLTAINGYSDLVLKRLRDDDPIRSNIVEIKKAGERSAALTRQLLAFSRQSVLQLKILNLNDIISDTSMMLGRLLGEDLHLKINLEPELGLIKSDLGQLSQVIINLAVNARDAMPDGGVLSITTANIEISSNFSEQPTEMLAGAYVLLTVNDTGVGIEKEHLENIFEPFFTTKVVGKGTGLGLATVYGIVKQSKGYIFVDSKINQGTTFRIYLPQAEDEADKPKVENGISKINKGTETILVVEDEPMVRALTRQILEECGYNIIEAANGVEALAVCENLNVEINLVLTDIVMPQMGGRELGEHLARIYKNMPVLFTSGYTDDERLSDHIIEKDANFIAKPFTFDELSNKVRKFLDSKRANR